ncbi:hypothetical protein BD560DRAFT_403129 [Blakeslea trispora]|nr:hypothetical protein BD560DRAFT_403129 [Blakeslea trispora]
MFEQEPSAPVRYALDDHDSDEELEASQALESVVIEIKANVTSPSTLVLGVDQPGQIYLDSLSLPPVGHIVRQSKEKATIYQQEDVVFVSFETVLPEEAQQYTRVMMNEWKVTKVIVLDSFRALGYVSPVYEDLVPPLLKVLQTSVCESKAFSLFESPNMVQGLSAALLNYCEIHAIACYGLLSFQESLYGQLLVTGELLTAYEMGLQKLGYHFTLDQQKLKGLLLSEKTDHRLYL